MKYIQQYIYSFLATFLFSFSVCYTQFATIDPSLLVITIMVKNEETVMVDTLKPFLDLGLQSYVILDTGSTDKTVEVTQELFDQYNVQHGHIVQKPFVNFSVSRNQAIESVEELFPDAEFIFMIDAEWYVDNIDSLVHFCQDNRHIDANSCLVNINAGSSNYYLQRLFRAHRNVRFEGPVHEVLNQVSYVKVPKTEIHYRPRNEGQAKTKERWFRDVSLLLKDIAEHPDNARTLFYLAQSYDCLGFSEEAAYWYKKRCQAGGWVEEHFMAHYRLATIYERLEDWNQALEYYIKAYTLRPNRAEPLIKLAQHYWHAGNYETSFLFAKRACELPYPKDDILFVDQIMYNYTRYDVLGCCSWYIAEYEIGKKAVEQALKAWPTATHLQRNLQLYSDKLNEMDFSFTCS